MLWAEDEQGPFYEEFERHKVAVEQKLRFYKDTPPIWSKYVWVAGYHNYFCDLHSHHFSDEHKVNMEFISANARSDRRLSSRGVVMAKLQGAERQRMIDVFGQSDAIHRIEGFEPTELRKALDQAVLDGLATNAQIAEELRAYIIAHRTTDGFRESRSWLPTLGSEGGSGLLDDPSR